MSYVRRKTLRYAVRCIPTPVFALCFAQVSLVTAVSFVPVSIIKWIRKRCVPPSYAKLAEA